MREMWNLPVKLLYRLWNIQADLHFCVCLRRILIALSNLLVFSVMNFWSLFINLFSAMSCTSIGYLHQPRHTFTHHPSLKIEDNITPKIAQGSSRQLYTELWNIIESTSSFQRLQKTFTLKGLRDSERAVSDILLDLGPWAADWTDREKSSLGNTQFCHPNPYLISCRRHHGGFFWQSAVTRHPAS